MSSSTETNKNSGPARKSNSGDRPLFTNEGLPIDHTLFGTSLTTASVAEGPTRRVSVGNVAQSFYAASKKSNFAAKAKPPITSVKPVSVEDDAAYAQTELSSKSPGGRRQNKRSHPFRSSLLDEEEYDFSSEPATQRPKWSSLLYDVSVLPILPSVNHPLEKTSVIVNGVSPSLIATRIQGALQRQSITASHLSPNKVQCISSAHVEFCIFLYRQNKSSEQDGIIVEVQRRGGFDVSYMTDVNAILDAASGKDATEQHQHDSSWPMYFEENSDDGGEGYQVPNILSQTFKKEKEPTVEEENVCLSSLASLTNEEKVGPTAIHVSREFLVSDECKELRSKVFSLIESSNDTSTSRSTLQSLEILANVCTCTRDLPKRLEPIFSSSEFELQSHLLTHLDNARNNPLAATYACIIFRRLAEEPTIANVTSARLTAALSNAVSLGGEIHAGLERQAAGCLSVML
mmetsp:Transcript_28292/g.40436  ORF Transcript_28292/g.40436 Transcript_28292/m.40436 type:complete len:460 (+) Transcript_28292:171-1550(+)|eukprot:CAMPEP_0201708600 /NCGR_PEP_ID=MMETSP0578-20130828/56135_1 /ASSEMBLY_ACC=CAM_ASM_000663 /TAXON_ID=267565 /ORGANISM="Skeletonema grethea, Strain CCMP 1804" /LENGTH=459 /DNA_ID=CAMNT_0048197477 /DNA_START=80 /DNA_END=1459 /DNA_ORIENTATION=-